MRFSQKPRVRFWGLLFMYWKVLLTIDLRAAVEGLAGTSNRRRPPNRRPGDSAVGKRDGIRSRNERNDNQKGSVPNNRINSGGKNHGSSKNNHKEASMLARAFRIMHDRGGTIAVLDGCRETIWDYDPQTLVEAALLASKDGTGVRRKGVSAGILNALLGCCCCWGGKQRSSARTTAVQLMQAYDALGEREPSDALTPDLVSLCLTYAATSSFPDENHPDHPMASEFLRRAEAFHPGPQHHHRDRDSSQTQPDGSRLEEFYGIRVLQDAPEFLVVSKPSGMVCYHGNSSASGNHRRRKATKEGPPSNDPSLEECLLECGIPLSTLNREGRGLVHRIDRGTSGCLVVAKTNRMHARLLAEFFLKRAQKSYRALVCCSSHHDARFGAAATVPIDGRPAVSRCTLEAPVGPHLARIRVQTQQGRRHQVRIHCAEGWRAPILLDPLYGGQSILSTLLEKKNPPRASRDGGDEAAASGRLQRRKRQRLLDTARASQQFCLHASTLAIDAVGIDAEAPLPEWWHELEAALREDA